MNAHSYDLAITGSILQGDRCIDEATVLITSGKIAAITSASAGFATKKHIQAQGKMILPGAIDSHVHSLSYPGEGFYHATRAACAGGVTTIIDMPVDAPMGVATPEAFEAKKKLLEK